MLVRLHSPRARKLTAMRRIGAERFGMAGNPWGQERRVKSLADGSLELTVDDAPRASRAAYLEDGGLIVWIGNEDLELIRGPAEARRRYLDFTGMQIDPGYRRAWSRYNRALRSKNALLKEAAPRLLEIASYEEILIESGTVLMDIRRQLAADLAIPAAHAQAAISGKNESLVLKYIPSAGEDLRAAITCARERELRQRQSVTGPHRDDLALEIQGLSAGNFASEGQQRTLALALKLAQGELLAAAGRTQPVYLVDDIFGELDPHRRNALMRHLPANAQKWITTTDLGWLQDPGPLHALARHTISDGGIS